MNTEESEFWGEQPPAYRQMVKERRVKRLSLIMYAVALATVPLIIKELIK